MLSTPILVSAASALLFHAHVGHGAAILSHELQNPATELTSSGTPSLLPSSIAMKDGVANNRYSQAKIPIIAVADPRSSDGMSTPEKITYPEGVDPPYRVYSGLPDPNGEDEDPWTIPVSPAESGLSYWTTRKSLIRDEKPWKDLPVASNRPVNHLGTWDEDWFADIDEKYEKRVKQSFADRNIRFDKNVNYGDYALHPDDDEKYEEPVKQSQADRNDRVNENTRFGGFSLDSDER